ncbi:MAG: NUDIX domain-containing protein [Spirochaetaceae bacterium]|jgi:8-oxo-dGTP diphosphatase|nr:NUDIX domain-containing protein [Spirochaetaceae bacterium]
MKCTVYTLGELKHYKYVVTFVRYNNKWVICKHKNRTTWETSGGHIEMNETPLEAAKRELYEETGAIDFDIIPVCDYWACDEPYETDKITWANGQVFLANVKEIGSLPESEMECIDFFNTFPRNLTYPDITDELLPYIIKTINKSGQEEIKQETNGT